MNTLKKINLLLSKLDKEQLYEFIREECACDIQFQNRFLALGAGNVFKPDSEIYTARVNDLIDGYTERNGYVTYREASDFNHEICRILDEADRAIQKRQWDVAFAVLTGVAAAGEDIVCSGDDSDGNLSSIIDECFNKLYALCNEEGLPQKMKDKLYEHSITRFSERHLESFDWWWNWMDMAVTLADTQDKRERVIKALDHIINTPAGDSWSIRYNIQNAQKYRLKIMSETGSPEERRKYMYDNVSHPDFRNELLQWAWDEENYDEVLRLAKDGLRHDSEMGGLVDKWHQWEFKVYLHLNDAEKILQFAKYFFFKGNNFGNGEYTMEKMYALMKSTVPAERWSDYVETLIEESFKKKNSVRRLFIYTQEKMWDRYMDYLRKNHVIYDFDSAPNEIRQLYKAEYLQLYASCINSYFESASNRDAYRYGVGLLRKLIQNDGKAEANEIIQKQKNRRPRRPALIDELSKLTGNDF